MNFLWSPLGVFATLTPLFVGAVFAGRESPVTDGPRGAARPLALRRRVEAGPCGPRPMIRWMTANTILAVTALAVAVLYTPPSGSGTTAPAKSDWYCEATLSDRSTPSGTYTGVSRGDAETLARTALAGDFTITELRCEAPHIHRTYAKNANLKTMPARSTTTTRSTRPALTGI